MVQKVILIGLIGLLIALSNASDKKSVTITIEDENYVLAALVHEKEIFVLKGAWNTTETQNATCPKDYEFYCKHSKFASICVKGKDLEGKSIKDDDHEVYQCEKAQNWIDVTPREWYSMMASMHSNVSPVGKEEFEKATNEEYHFQTYCYVLGHNHSASTGKKAKNQIFIFELAAVYEKIKQRRGLKMNKKVHYDLFTCGNPAEIKKDVEAYEAAYDYDQKPFYKKPQKMLFIFVLLAIAASACYWFLCCDKDDEDEEKDQNKAADP